MKKLLLIFSIVVTQVVFAEQIRFPTSPVQAPTPTPTPNTLFFSNIISEMELQNIIIQGEGFTTLHLDGYVFHGEVGYPKLPAKTQLLEVPVGAQIKVNILASKYLDIPLNEKGFQNQIAPVQPPVRKSAKNIPPLAKNRDAYRQRTFTSRDLVDIEDLGIMKDRHLVQLNILPVQYLATENVVRVYYFIEFEVVFNENTGTEPKKSAPVNQTKPKPTTLTTKTVPNSKVYQIISDRKFENTLLPFVNWKTQKGFDVRVAYTDQTEVGKTTTSIKSYLKGIYESDERADYLLLVGSINEIPSFSTSLPISHMLIEYEPHVTDLYYAEYTNDKLPDVFYGRLSAKTPQELSNQIEKILAMEQLTVPSAFLKNSLLIAGEEGNQRASALLNATINYAKNHYFNPSNNINATVLLNPGSGGQTPLICSTINNGVGFVNYTGHGELTAWQDPRVNNANVTLLNNENRYPFVISNACFTNKFDHWQPSFGETWLRVPQKGAVAHIGASSYTYFEEDVQWSVGAVSATRDSVDPNNLIYQNTKLGVFDRLFRTHGEPFSEWASTAGEILFFGSMAVQLGNATYNNDMKTYYWEVYHIMGDPSYMPYLYEPQDIQCTHPKRIAPSETSLTIETIPFAYVGLSKAYQLLAAGQADSKGDLTLTLPQELPLGLMQLVVTAPNHRPYQTNIEVTDVGMPIVSVINHKLSKDSNIVAQLTFGDTLDFSIELKNHSNYDASDVRVVLQTNNTFVKIARNIDIVPVLVGLDSVWVKDYQLIIPLDIPNRHNIRLSVTITYNDSLSVLHHFHFVAAAPYFTVSNFNTTDEDDGTITLTNSGLADLSDAEIRLVSRTDGASISNPNPTIATFPVNSAVPISFDLTKAPSAPEFLPYTLELTVQKGQYHYYQTLLQSGFGNLIEDFERGYFHDSIWWRQTGYQFAWEIDSTDFYEGRFAMRNIKIDDNQMGEMFTQDFDLIGGDSIVFHYKVSSEKDYDGLEFWIATLREDGYYNGVLVAFFSGEIPWTRAAFPVSEGTQYFNWTYYKDNTYSSGKDRAWVDHITFPKMKQTPVVPPATHIGKDDVCSICGEKDCGGTCQTSIIYMDVQNIESLQVYPNPITNGILFVEIPDGVDVGAYCIRPNCNKCVQGVCNTPLRVQIYDLSGKLLLSHSISRTTHPEPVSINVSHLPNGTYIVKIDNYSARIIKQ